MMRQHLEAHAFKCGVFDATMNDTDFLAEADRLKLEIEPVSGAQVQKLMADLYKSSPEVLARAKEVMAAGPAASVAKPKP